MYPVLSESSELIDKMSSESENKHTEPPPSYPRPSEPSALAHGIVKSLSSQVISWVMEEISSKDVVNAKLKDGFVLPVLKIVQQQLTPYAIITMIVAFMLIILVLINLVITLLIYFRRS
jgi:hypothetical protein